MNEKTIIIAEAGVNHNGSLDLAKKLVDYAEQAGADYIKFQTFKTENNISRTAPKAEYQLKYTSADESQFEMVKKLELTEQDHLILIDYCANKNLKFLSTPFDLESIDLLKKLGITLGKIPSGEIVNLPYLRKMAESFPNLILSTGMSTLDEIKQALDVLTQSGIALDKITVMQCNTEYPTPYEDVNLKAMINIRDLLNVPIGYSDHTQGIEIPIAAVAMGAQIIEKHFTLDKNMAGPDHKASLEPDELATMIKAIRNVEKSKGSGIKEPSASEIKNRSIVRKSIVAKTSIKKGDALTSFNITVKRPGTGISPMEWDKVIGTIASRDFKEDESIEI